MGKEWREKRGVRQEERDARTKKGRGEGWRGEGKKGVGPEMYELGCKISFPFLHMPFFFFFSFSSSFFPFFIFKLPFLYHAGISKSSFVFFSIIFLK